jgi:hypothetical protein
MTTSLYTLTGTDFPPSPRTLPQSGLWDDCFLGGHGDELFGSVALKQTFRRSEKGGKRLCEVRTTNVRSRPGSGHRCVRCDLALDDVVWPKEERLVTRRNEPIRTLMFMPGSPRNDPAYDRPAQSTDCRNSRVRGCSGLVKSLSGWPSSQIRPLSKKQTRSETSRAKRISWVTSSIVRSCS